MNDYFCGWYYKCQSEKDTLAVIPALHRTGGKTTCSIQLITEAASWSVPFPGSAFREDGGQVAIGENRFGPQGLHLHLRTPGLLATGTLRFGPFTPLRYDIMGPLRYVPFLECRHSVFSMRHTVAGTLQINGVPRVFQNGTGYAEGDRGRSFPKGYVWTQCVLPGGALMLAAADIPWGGLHFIGVTAAVLWQGKQYRLATYLGAKAVAIQNGAVTIRQGHACLTARLLAPAGQPLRAPSGGAMVRTIHEHAACRVFYRFQIGEDTLFALEVPNASFEYEFSKKGPV